MEACTQDSCKRFKESNGEKPKEVCVSSLDDALQNFSCNIKHQLIENKQCLFGAVARATLKTAATWGTCRLIETMDKAFPEWATK
jgi:hypothetical protein